MKIQLLLTFFLTVTFSAFSQNIDSNKVTKRNEANLLLDSLRGILTADGYLFYIEKDNETVTCYKDKKIVWQINVLRIYGKPYLGEPYVRYIGLYNNQLTAIYGKHNFIRFNPKTGEITGSGSG